MVNQRGIEANPEKVKALIDINPPRTVRDVQRLTGMVAAFNRFISKCSEKCQSFFSTLKKKKNF
ncbi:hypothetical protein, partial [Staphylococcus nepalensis]|uniref:hypothetical protein n=1 Tax=Staphylococcus nepalensis TaxID=214473 RepID=UPI0028581702